MKINVHAGHNYHVTGASGKFSETKEARNVKDKVIALLREQGHTVYDCTDEDGRTQNGNLANIVHKCNAHTVDLDVSIHFNAYNGTAHGVEVCVPTGSTQKERAKRICDKISALGFSDRGIKYRDNLYVLNRTTAPALLVECCFCDSAKDAKLYDAAEMAKAIVEGITGKRTSAQEDKHTFTVRVTSERANLRAEASKNSELIGVVQAGDTFAAADETENWYKLTGGGFLGKKHAEKEEQA